MINVKLSWDSIWDVLRQLKQQDIEFNVKLESVQGAEVWACTLTNELITAYEQGDTPAEAVYNAILSYLKGE